MQTSPPKKKKMLVAAAIFVLPLAVIVGLILSLTNRPSKAAPAKAAGSAFNTSMPSPNLPSATKNKLEIYMQAEQDSIRTHQLQDKDPYALRLDTPSAKMSPPPQIGSVAAVGPKATFPVPARTVTADDNEKKVQDGLQRLYAALGQSAPNQNQGRALPNASTTSPFDGSIETAHMDRLMAALQAKDTATSPQLQQVSQVLDKIMAITHPERSRTPEPDSSRLPQEVTTAGRGGPFDDPIDLRTYRPSSTGFLGFDDEGDTMQTTAPAILAVIHSDQVVLSGSIVKLRLLQDIYVGGQRVAANSFIYGMAAISGERVSIQLSNVVAGDQVYPVALKVYDAVDGLEGIYVPGMITRDVVKENASAGVSGMSIGTLDPSLGAQAAAAGIETAKSLISKKIRLLKATLKEGHLVTLRPAFTTR
jgi:conjugative transposon TraM protein